MNVLYLESSDFQKQIIQEILVTHLNYELFLSGDIDDALSIIEKKNIDCILASANLTEDLAKNLLNELNLRKQQDIAVLILTSDDPIKIKNKFLSYGLVEVISKYEINVKTMKEYFDNLEKEKSKPKINYTDVKIALLNDNKVTMLSIIDILKTQDVQNVSPYMKGDLFFKDFEENPECFDFLVIDLILPDTNGIEVLKRIRELNKDVPVMLASSITNYNTISLLLDIGVDEFLQKPFEPDVFLIRMKTALKTAEYRKRIRENGEKS